MSRRPRSPRPAPHDYTPDIERLNHRLAACRLGWQGVAPMPPAMAEAVEELTTTVEELYAMNEDLTQTQQAALESQRRYQELFDGVPDAYLVTDLQSLILEANRAAGQLFHLHGLQLVGLPLAVCIAWEERRAFRTQLAWLRNGAEVREWVIRVQPPHHPAVQVACHVAPARDAEGRLCGLRWLLRLPKDPPPVQETSDSQVRDLTPEWDYATGARQAAPDRTELRMRELHHRMKNHLQVVCSLLDWRLGDLHDPQVRAVVQECQGRIRAMALLHEHLYRAGDVERLELGDYLRRLALQLLAAYGIDRERITLTLQLDAVNVETNTALPCGLLAHEVLSNCLQHAFPGDRAGAVALTLRAEPPGQVTLTIRDTGVGIPAGLDPGQGDSFGLSLVRTLTEQLQGTLVVTRDQGACVTLRFPI
jgi:PAS domain S-box-containing protein